MTQDEIFLYVFVLLFNLFGAVGNFTIFKDNGIYNATLLGYFQVIVATLMTLVLVFKYG